MNENEKNKIIKLRAAGAGYVKIAREMGMSVNTVKSFCRRKNINAETASDFSVKYSGETTTCVNCGRVIQQIAKQKPRKYCCDQCRNQYWARNLDKVKRKAYYKLQCRHCGKEFQIYGDRNRKYCSHACYIADRFNGGVSHD